MRDERLVNVLMIPFDSFKEKIRLTKKYSRYTVRIINDCVYVEIVRRI